MALTINYNFKITYGLGRLGSKESYARILTSEQLGQLEESVVKEFQLENAYCKIDSLNGNKDNIEIKVGIYKNELKQISVTNKSYTFSPSLESADNFIKQGYEYLKTLEEYANALDC